MRKIIIPTDFSENSLNAATYALELFKYFRSEVFIVHAYADEVYNSNVVMKPSEFEEVKNEKRTNSEHELEKFKSKVIEHFHNPKHHLYTLSVFGSLVDVVNDLVDEENIDVVAMGTRGETNDKKITFGSNTLQVIRYVNCPVLAVPENYHDILPKKILFPSDFMLPFKQRELKLLGTMAERITATIHCLYISKFEELSNRQEDNKAFLELAFAKNKVSFPQVVGKDITEAINEYIKENEMDLLVMVNSRHSYLENILYTSTIEKIGLHIQIPFLVLQNLQRY
ncbi:universal stress protein [Ulvibacter litoralis]|uniref:Nucleotide-binding universal stress protein, UspA family n=1 Tax=Ulvibacter litoralis TaxID=227084 RepID=A0A1G7IA34_9FLAO|nr:universal stress protein [Ulvibacter litoralis]GHC62058.1 universal stress protein [Ulvibacter litoralis]SDF09376.1 Nucleotide-binding universal stress protein, UspA family [Ulvibacter litoralis]